MAIPYLSRGPRVLSPGSPAALGAFTLIIRNGSSGREMLLRAAGRPARRHPVAGARAPRPSPAYCLGQPPQVPSDIGGSPKAFGPTRVAAGALERGACGGCLFFPTARRRNAPPLAFPHIMIY